MIIKIFRHKYKTQQQTKKSQRITQLREGGVGYNKQKTENQTITQMYQNSLTIKNVSRGNLMTLFG